MDKTLIFLLVIMFSFVWGLSQIPFIDDISLTVSLGESLINTFMLWVKGVSLLATPIELIGKGLESLVELVEYLKDFFS